MAPRENTHIRPSLVLLGSISFEMVKIGKRRVEISENKPKISGSATLMVVVALHWPLIGYGGST